MKRKTTEHQAINISVGAEETERQIELSPPSEHNIDTLDMMLRDGLQSAYPFHRDPSQAWSVLRARIMEE